MKIFKCPVCGNPRIPDYHKEKVVCPQCGCDLGIYKALTEISSNDRMSKLKILNYRKLLILLPVTVFLVACALFYFVLYNNVQQTYNDELASKDACIVSLRDSLFTMTSSKSSAMSTSEYMHYIVIKNDSPWIIVKKVFGNTENWIEKFENIAKDNSIWDDETKTWSMIHPGQILKIRQSE